MFKVLALDLDGTLLNSGLRLSDGNAEAVRAAMERGVQVVLATARFYGIALRTASRLGVETPLICSNGALVKRPTDGHELIHLYVDHDLAREVTTLGDERGWEMRRQHLSPRYTTRLSEVLRAGCKINFSDSDVRRWHKLRASELHE